MEAEIRCANPKCGRPSRLGSDALGRTFRCMSCGTKLPRGSQASATGDSTMVEAADGADRPWEAECPSARRALGVALPSRVGRFQVLSLLGSGTCATVYRAFDPDLEREVALKVPHPGTISGKKSLSRFLGEAKALARLLHPRVAPIFEVGSVGDVPFLATAYIPGRNLARVLEDGPLDPRRCAWIAAELAEALGYAHSLGIVHRDVKPANVLVGRDGMIHLTDFGLAHRIDAAKLTAHGALIGTPAYVAPEQSSSTGDEPVSASDQYSLGVVLYEMLCGRTPFLGPPQLVVYSARHEDPPFPRALRPSIPRALERICMKAMARQPSDRYASCDVLASDLRRWLESDRLAPERTASVSRAVGWFRRRPAAAVSTVLLLIGAAATMLLATSLLASTSSVPADSSSPGPSTTAPAVGPFLAASPEY